MYCIGAIFLGSFSFTSRGVQLKSITFEKSNEEQVDGAFAFSLMMRGYNASQKSPSQLPRVWTLLILFIIIVAKADSNWSHVGLVLRHPWLLTAPKKFSNGSWLRCRNHIDDTLKSSFSFFINICNPFSVHTQLVTEGTVSVLPAEVTNFIDLNICMPSTHVLLCIEFCVAGPSRGLACIFFILLPFTESNILSMKSKKSAVSWNSLGRMFLSETSTKNKTRLNENTQSKPGQVRDDSQTAKKSHLWYAVSCPP